MTKQGQLVAFKSYIPLDFMTRKGIVKKKEGSLLHVESHGATYVIPAENLLPETQPEEQPPKEYDNSAVFRNGFPKLMQGKTYQVWHAGKWVKARFEDDVVMDWYGRPYINHLKFVFYGKQIKIFAQRDLKV